MMKDSIQKKIIALLAAALGVTILTTAVRSVFLFTAYEANVGYFKRGLPSVTVSLLFIVGILFCVGLLFLLPKKGIVPGGTSPYLSLVLKIPATVASFFCGVFYLGNGISNSIIMNIFIGFLSVLSAFYFLFSLISDFPQHRGRFTGARLWCGLAFIIKQILFLATAYFDHATNINGPFTTLYLFSLLSCAAFLLTEARYDLGAPAPRMNFAIGVLAFFLSFSSSVGNLLFCLFSNTGASVTLSDPFRPILMLTFSLFILHRLLSFTVAKQEK